MPFGGTAPFMTSRQTFSRNDRVRKALMKEMADILMTEIKDPRFDHQVISVTDIDLSGDLSHAKIFFSILADEDTRTELMTLILEYKPRIRKAIGQRIRLRHTPDIDLRLDDSLERGTRITALLNKIERGELD
jgi:ribosome-binding factor A